MDMDCALDIDDEEDIIMLENTEITQSNVKSMTDVIDLDEENASNDNRLINELTAHQTSPRKQKTDLKGDEEDFAKLLRSNMLMTKIIMKCLNMDNNKGMQTVINKSLLPIYKKVDIQFKKSDNIIELLNKIMKKLKQDPTHKFSHIKTLCTELKKNEQQRKKVAFMTLTTDIKALKKQSVQKKRTIGDAGNTKESAIIDLDDYVEKKVINIDDIDESDDDIMFVEINKDKTVEQSNKENCFKANTKTEPIEAVNEDKNLLVETTSVSSDQYSSDSDREEALVKEIEFYKSLLQKLEEQEVTTDSSSSPYLQCGRIKAKIVELYKTLCTVTGGGDDNILKQRFIRLQAVEGHPPGPIRRLEKFLNNTIDKTGCIPLPDFHDVVRCVTQSNIVDRLGWDKQQITNEAVALFTHCGHALRENRQKREYKDLISLMRERDIDENDPANEDPVLLARLEENKLIAQANETEVIDRYANMEDMSKLPYTVKPGQRRIFRIKSASSDTDSENENDKNRKKIQSTMISNNNKINNMITRKDNEHVINKNNGDKFIDDKVTNSTSLVQKEQQPLHTPTNTSTALLNKRLVETSPLLKQLLNTSKNFDYKSFVIDKGKSEINDKTDKAIKDNLSNTNCIKTQYNANAVKDIENNKIEQSTDARQKDGDNFSSVNKDNSNNNTRATIINEKHTDIRHSTACNIKQNINVTGNIKETRINKPLDLPNRSNKELTETQIRSDSTPENVNSSHNVTVKLEKPEPEDFSKLFSRLGDNFITTIFDIEDPFVVIDISSDSSSDDEL